MNNKKDEDIRRRVRKLTMLVNQCGNPAKFAKAYSKDYANKPINHTFVNQIIKGKRTFGENAARNMEDMSTLPSGYFDSDIDDPNVEVFQTRNDKRKIIIRKILDSPENTLDAINGFLDIVIQIPAEDNKQEAQENK